MYVPLEITKQSELLNSSIHAFTMSACKRCIVKEKMEQNLSDQKEDT